MSTVAKASGIGGNINLNAVGNINMKQEVL